MWVFFCHRLSFIPGFGRCVSPFIVPYPIMPKIHAEREKNFFLIGFGFGSFSEGKERAPIKVAPPAMQEGQSFSGEPRMHRMKSRMVNKWRRPFQAPVVLLIAASLLPLLLSLPRTTEAGERGHAGEEKVKATSQRRKRKSVRNDNQNCTYGGKKQSLVNSGKDMGDRKTLHASILIDTISPTVYAFPIRRRPTSLFFFLLLLLFRGPRDGSRLQFRPGKEDGHGEEAGGEAGALFFYYVLHFLFMCRYMINIPYVSSYKDYFAIVALTGKKENFTAAFERAVPTKKSIRRDFSLQLPALPDGEQKNARHNTRFWGPKRQKNILSQKIFKIGSRLSRCLFKTFGRVFL